jgi:hypothetical protein
VVPGRETIFTVGRSGDLVEGHHVGGWQSLCAFGHTQAPVCRFANSPEGIPVGRADWPPDSEVLGVADHGCGSTALRVCRNLLIALWLPDKASVIELLKGENDSGRNSYLLTAFLQRQPTILLDSRRVPFQKPGRIGQSAFSASSFYLNISPP